MPTDAKDDLCGRVGIEDGRHHRVNGGINARARGIELIHALWRDGIDVAVFDPDVVSDEVLGSNRRYLEQHLPQAPTVLKRSVAEATTGADTLIVAQDRPEFAAAAASAPDDVRVLDLVRVNGLDVSSPSYSGLSW